ncbi:hypothetical protein [Arcobacter aquimarinus]|uniref:hypothetical protein n=1 Tax=Arcobacter aquimarinus TaxID=1315211 RepID=UPI003BAF14EF
MKKNMITSLSEKSTDEIIIKIAYTFYKNQKVEYISSLSDEIKNDSSKLNTQLQEFYRTAYLNSSIETYITQAQDFVEGFAEQISNIALDQFQTHLDEKDKEFNTIINNEKNESKAKIEGMEKVFNTNFEAIIKKNVSSFGSGVAQGVIASFLFFLISGLIIFFTWLKDIPGDKIASAFLNGDKATAITKEDNQSEKPTE